MSKSKPKKVKKLSLNKASLKELSNEDASKVQGGLSGGCDTGLVTSAYCKTIYTGTCNC